MRRASTLAAVLAASAGLLLADAALAQSGPRYLSWSGRGEATPPQGLDPAEPAPVRRDARRPNPVIPHGGAAAREPAPNRLTPAPGPVRRSLTPANAWLRPAAPPPETVLAPAPAPVVASVRPATAQPAPPPPPPPGPEYLPQGGRGQPAPAEIIYPAPARPAEIGPGAAADPMAPRRDALIFQMQSATPPPPETAPEPVPAAPRADAPPRTVPVTAVAGSGEAPPARSGGRYYSVHRQNGRQPDALSIPEPTYVDRLVVSDIETMASQDLAAPEQGPTLIRDRNGNMRAAPAPSDGDHQ